MKRIDLGQWYQLGAAVQPFLEIPTDTSFINLYVTARDARKLLGSTINSDVFGLAASVPSGKALVTALEKFLSRMEGVRDVGSPIHHDIRQELSAAAATFKTILLAELQQLDAYFVSRKGTYSTRALIACAEATFIDDIAKVVLTVEVVAEIREWGRCFAFELSTASGFHIMRATELVILEYLRILTGAPAAVEERTWTGYIAALKHAGADEHVKVALHQIKNLHRNPLMHPTDVLTLGQADALFGLAKAAITAIAVDVRNRTAA